MMITIYIVLGIALALFYYWAIMRACKYFKLHEKNKAVSRVVSALVAVGIAVICVINLTVALLSLHIMVITPIVVLIDFIIKKAYGEKYENGCKPWKITYYCSVIPVVVASAVIIGGYVNMNSVTATEHAVYTQKSIRAEGYKIALIADVHYGISVNGTEFKRICNEISAKGVDMVVLCGDIVDEDTTRAGMEEVFSALGGIDSAYGVYYVYGNHDRQLYTNNAVFTEAELEQVIIDNGITVLRDGTVDVGDEIVLAGREDMSYRGEDKRKPIADILNDVDKSKLIITLDHQPGQYKANAEAGTDLLLSGHTHNGQVWPMNWILSLTSANEAMSGYTRIEDNAQAYVTVGFAGWGFNVKTAGRAEYVILTILPEA